MTINTNSSKVSLKQIVSPQHLTNGNGRRLKQLKNAIKIITITALAITIISSLVGAYLMHMTPTLGGAVFASKFAINPFLLLKIKTINSECKRHNAQTEKMEIQIPLTSLSSNIEEGQARL